MWSVCSGMNTKWFLMYVSMSKDRVLLTEDGLLITKAVCAIHK